jgi:hypothetical protein
VLRGSRGKSVILMMVLALGWGGAMYAVRLVTQVPSISHHEDPAFATADSDPTAIFEWYRTALSPFTVGQFNEGRRLLKALAGTTLPADIQSLVKDLNGILLEEATTLEEAEGLLRRASDLIAAGRPEAARPLLAQLNRLARLGSILFDEGVQGLSDLARRTNLEALPYSAPQRRAYDDLQRLAARVKALLVTFRALAQNPKSIVAVARLLGTRQQLTFRFRVAPTQAATSSSPVLSGNPPRGPHRGATLLFFSMTRSSQNSPSGASARNSSSPLQRPPVSTASAQ